MPAAVIRQTWPTVVTAIRSPPHTPVRSMYSEPRMRPLPSPGSDTHGSMTVAPLSEMRTISPSRPLPTNRSPVTKPPTVPDRTVAILTSSVMPM